MVDKDFSDAKRDNWTSQPLKGQITSIRFRKRGQSEDHAYENDFFALYSPFTTINSLQEPEFNLYTLQNRGKMGE